jgi:hypothetical protein
MSGDFGGDGLKLRPLSALFALLCLTGAAMTHAKAKSKEPLQIGENRDLSSRKTKTATMFLYWSDYGQEFMRDPAFDEANSRIEQGPYPNKDQKAQDHEILVKLSISDIGAITGCDMLKPSEVQSINDHVCPHLISYGRLHPALDMQGQPVAAAGEVSVYYSIFTFDPTVTLKPPVFMQAPAYTGPPNQREAAPVTGISAEDLGLTPELVAKHKISSIALSVLIDENGMASACRFHNPTYDNALDRDICAKATQQKFNPTTDHYGEAKSSYYSLTLDFEEME